MLSKFRVVIFERSRKVADFAKLNVQLKALIFTLNVEMEPEFEELEKFLDLIEDPCDQTLIEFQNSIEEIKPTPLNQIEEEESIFGLKSIFDGERNCKFQGALNTKGLPTGDGALIYPVKIHF